MPQRLGRTAHSYRLRHSIPAAPPLPPVGVVIPTSNEAENLPAVFRLLPADLHEVIVVDGHSLDGTVDVARRLRPDVQIVMQNRHGRGNAMACGFAAVSGDIVVMLDADGSADPREISRFVAALVAGTDYAKGSPFIDGAGSADITRTRVWGNRWLNRATNLLFRTELTDLCYGYNAFCVHCLSALALNTGERERDDRCWGTGSGSRRSPTTGRPRPNCASPRFPASSSPNRRSEQRQHLVGRRPGPAGAADRALNGIGKDHGAVPSAYRPTATSPRPRPTTVETVRFSRFPAEVTIESKSA